MSVGTNRIGMPDRMRTTPIGAPRTDRPVVVRNLTSGNAGKMIPVMVMPLLREDSVAGARFRLTFAQDETVEILMNSVNVRVLTYLVPKLAFDRFDGWDLLNRSYEKAAAGPNGGTVPQWFETYTEPADPKTNQIHYALGKHMKAGTTGNYDYVEAYNAIWNYRAKNRSPHLTPRARLDMTLAPAFWNHQTWQYVVPDFDQAIIDGQVPLNVVNSKMPVKGLGLSGTSASVAMNGVRESGNTSPSNFAAGLRVSNDGVAANTVMLAIKTTGPAGGTSQYPDVWSELAANGITVSLSNIELARKTQAFANMRREYAGHSDEFLIDMLMDGLTVPDEAWKRPILLSDESTIFGMAKRWATDGASLTDSVTNGATFVDIGFSCPKVPCSGVIMTVVEIAPEQLFERQKDPYLHCVDQAKLPHYLRDELDPEKVEIVTCDQVDVLHSTGSATFGYAPMNHSWAKSAPNVGGRFTRPNVDAFVEARQRIWAVETASPLLGRDFYLCTNMHYNPFVVTDAATDHYEIMMAGTANIRGLTVFGQLLIESTDDYTQVLAKADQTRITKTAVPFEAELDEAPSSENAPPVDSD